MNFTDWVKARQGSHRNVMVAIVGPTGSGKSYAGMKVCEILDPTFDISHVVFSTSEFLDAIDKVKDQAFLIFDEAGLGFSHREFQTQINRMMSMVFQTFRYKFVNVIFTLPKLGFMDYVGRSLIHGVIRMTDQGAGVWYKVSPNALGDEIYTPRQGTVEFSLPAKAIRQAYEKKKSEYLDKLYESFAVEAKSKEVAFRYMPVAELAKWVKKDSEAFSDEGKLDAYLIAGQLGINLTKAYLVRRLASR